MPSALSASLKCLIVTLGSLIHIPPLPGWNTNGLVGVADFEAIRRRSAGRRAGRRAWSARSLSRINPVVLCLGPVFWLAIDDNAPDASACSSLPQNRPEGSTQPVTVRMLVASGDSYITTLSSDMTSSLPPYHGCSIEGRGVKAGGVQMYSLHQKLLRQR
ncbi:hypothetical protein D9M71_455480 [compost metagenome]